MAESMLAGSSRSLRKRVAATGWGTVRVLPVYPSGMGWGASKDGLVETSCRRKRLLPVTVQGWVVSAEHWSWERVGRRTIVASGSQSLAGAAVSSEVEVSGVAGSL
jgi:hypothetical protein